MSQSTYNVAMLAFAALLALLSLVLIQQAARDWRMTQKRRRLIRTKLRGG